MGERIMEAIGLKTHEPVVEVRHPACCKAASVWPTRSCFHTPITGTSKASTLQICSAELKLVHASVCRSTCVCPLN